MLVVADQGARRVGAERRLAGAAQPEEHRRAAVGADVRRTVHRHDALRRQQVVEDREHRLLHLARIARAADQDRLAFEVDRDDRFAAAAVAGGIGLEAGQVDDGEFGQEVGQRRRLRADQQRADEQRMPRQFGDDADLHAVFGLRPAEQVLDEQRLLRRERGGEVGADRGELFGGDRLVGLAPPDDRAGNVVVDDELVVRRPPGVAAGFDDERAVLRQQPLAAGNGMLDQRRRRQVPVQRRRGRKAERVEPMAGSGRGHGRRLQGLAAACSRLRFDKTLTGTRFRASKPALAPPRPDGQSGNQI